MSYFPLKKMPLTVKKEAPGATSGASRITADDYNFHDQELAAIEEWLGTAPYLASKATDSDEESLALGLETSGILHLIARISEKINVLLEEGFASASGCVISGQKIMFPEDAHAAFLKLAPATTSKEITVESTLGFSENGVISILNDASQGTRLPPSSMVEWIKYEGKTPTQFLNCTRGHLGSTIGRHAGFFTTDAVTMPNSKKNEADVCVQYPAGRTCGRRHPGWKYKDVYSLGAFGLVGTLLSITRHVRVNAGGLDISIDQRMVDAARELGILGSRDNAPILLSSTPGFSALNQLSWGEAESYITALADSGVVKVVRRAQDWLVPPFSIPVFQGMMGVQYSVASIGIVPRTANDSLVHMDVLQSATGQVYLTRKAPAQTDSVSASTIRADVVHGTVGYKAFFVSSGRTIGEKY